MRGLLAAAAVAALTGCGTTQTVRGTAVAGAAVSRTDRAWLAEVHQADLADVQAGKLAQHKGGTAAVRRAGGMLATEHTEFDAKLTRVADSLGVDLPASEGSRHLAAARRLEKESGGRFDTDFVTTMAEGHEKLIAATEDEIRTGTAPAVRDLARQALPDLRRHLEMLRRADPVG